MNNENKHIGNHDSMEASSNLVCFYSFDIIVSDLWLWSLSCFLQREASLFQAKNQIEEAFGRVNHRWRICRFIEGRIYRALVLEGLPGAVGSIEGTRVLWNQDMSWLANFDDIVWMVASYLIIEWCIYFFLLPIVICSVNLEIKAYSNINYVILKLYATNSNCQASVWYVITRENCLQTVQE